MYYMRKALLILLILIFIQPACFSVNKKMSPDSSPNINNLPNIFIYSLPDSDDEEIVDKVYVEEDNTAESSQDVIMLDDTVLGATTLKGYAEYIEDSDAIHLKDENNQFVLNIKVPQKIAATKGMNLKRDANQTLKYIDAEYAIAPTSIKTSGKSGDFTFGATYGNEIDNIAMLEKETGLFTKYEKNKFALSSTVKKSLNTTYAQDYNTISIAPEFKLNNHLSLKNVLSADVTRNRRSTKLVFSVNPLKDTDRLLLELGAKETIYLDTDFTKTEFSFSTIFKL